MYHWFYSTWSKKLRSSFSCHFYRAFIESSTDYSPFGATLYGRSWKAPKPYVFQELRALEPGEQINFTINSMSYYITHQPGYEIDYSPGFDFFILSRIFFRILWFYIYKHFIFSRGFHRGPFENRITNEDFLMKKDKTTKDYVKLGVDLIMGPVSDACPIIGLLYWGGGALGWW